MDAQDIATIIGAVVLGAPVTAAAIVSVVMAFKTNAKLDAAADRREEIAEAIIDPNVTELPPK